MYHYQKNKNRGVFWLYWLILLPLWYANAQAAPSAQLEELMEMDLSQLLGLNISIGTGRPAPLSQVPVIATVITAKEIRAMGATDISEVLERVPGLHVGRDVLSYYPLFTFRGIYSNFNPQVLVLINGISISNLFFSDRSRIWGGMPVAAIARIEVIRGPGSALYGADAFAGVINIISKQAQEIDGLEAGTRIGSLSTEDAWLLYGGQHYGLEVAFSLEYHQSAGNQRTIVADAQTFNDSLFGTNASLAPGPQNNDRKNYDLRLDLSRGHWRLRTGLQRRRNFKTALGIAQALDPHGRFRSDRWNLDLSYNNPDLHKDWEIEINTSYFDTSQEVERESRLFPPGSDLGFGVFANGVISNPEPFERHARFNASAFYAGFAGHYLRIGGGFNYQSLYKFKESTNFGIDPSGAPIAPGSPAIDVTDTIATSLRTGNRKNYYGFLQDEWAIHKNWQLTTGIRYDDYSDFGGTLNPRVALVWKISPKFTGKALYGQAFRVPSFFETRGQNNPTVLGNPNLSPEQLDNYELALHYQPNPDFQLSTNIFYYRWQDIIRFIANADGLSRTAQNAGEQTGYGLELEADWQFSSDVVLTANYSFQKAKDEEKDADAGNTPHHTVYVSGEWRPWTHWRIHTQILGIFDRDRVFADNRPDLDDYYRVDLNIRRVSLLKRVELAFIVRNLFNSDLREPSPAGQFGALVPNDLPLAGRTLLGEVRVNF